MKQPPVIALIVQARMGSSRLTGKVMRKIVNQPILEILLNRLHLVKSHHLLIVATTQNQEDDQIEAFCKEKRVFCFRGSEDDVLDRFYSCAKAYHADIIVRITGDCPLIDPKIVDRLINFYLTKRKDCDYASNTLKRTFPRGMDVEIFSKQALEKAAIEALTPSQREHVTPYFYQNPALFHLLGIEHLGPNLSMHRWTVDTKEDFTLVEKLFEAACLKNPHFDLNDLVTVIQEHPDWVKINAHIEQKKP